MGSWHLLDDVPYDVIRLCHAWTMLSECHSPHPPELACFHSGNLGRGRSITLYSGVLRVGYYCFVLSFILLTLLILCVFYTIHHHLTHLPSSHTHLSASATPSPNKKKLQRKSGGGRIGKSPHGSCSVTQ